MPIPSSYLKVTMNFKNNTTGAKATCGLWYEPISGGFTLTLANIATAANAFKTAFSTAVAAALTIDHEMTSVTLKQVNSGTEVEGQNTNGAVVGEVAGDTLPEEDVLCIVRRTGLVGRNKRGRIFFPFVPEDFVENGQLNEGGKNAAAGLAGMVKSDVVAGGVTYAPQNMDYKNSVMNDIEQAGYNDATCSRRDRRYPKRLTQIRV